MLDAEAGAPLSLAEVIIACWKKIKEETPRPRPQLILIDPKFQIK